MSAQPVAAPEPLLRISDLHAYYGAAHVLQGVDLALHSGSLGIIGRNGMGKTTLCNVLVQMRPPHARGSIVFDGHELVGKPAQKVAQLGIGYVPQGRRLFPSLSVEEHMRLIRVQRGARWGVDEVYELFPRLAQRRKVGGTQLSGGEQQMLAIGRALLTNPKLLIMDEPSEGLAPAIVESLVDTFRTLTREGLSILVVEQNLSVATAIAERQLVMVGGRIAAEVSSEELAGDPVAQRRWLGVDHVGDDAATPAATPAKRTGRGRRAGAESA